MQTRTPQVGVDHQRGVATLRTNIGEIDQGRGLAFARAAGNHGDRIVFRVFPVELDVGPQDSVGLGIRAHAALLVQHSDVLRNDGEHRHLQIPLDVLKALHRGIEVFEEQGDAHSEDQPDHGAKHEVQRDVGSHRTLRDHRVIMHHGDVVGHLLGNLLTDEFEFQRLQQVLVGIKVALGVVVVLGIQSAFDRLVAAVILHDFHPLEPGIRKIQLHLERLAQGHHPFVQLALHRTHQFGLLLDRRVIVAETAAPERVELGPLFQISWVKHLDDVIRQIETGRERHQLFFVVTQQTLDRALKLHLFLLEVVINLQREPCPLVFVDAAALERVGSRGGQDLLGPHDIGEHLAAFFDFLFLRPDGVAHLDKRPLDRLSFLLLAIVTVSRRHLRGNRRGIFFLLISHADLDQVRAADVLGIDDVPEDAQHGLRILPPLRGQLQAIDHLVEGVAALDFLELRLEKPGRHPGESTTLVEITAHG